MGSTEIAQNVYIRGNDGSWPIPPGCPREGKQAHIASVVQAIRSVSPDHAPSASDHIMLIDDDINNIAVADSAGYRAVPFPVLPLPGINMRSHQAADGVNTIHRTQLRYGAILCISTGTVVSFNGNYKGGIVNAANRQGLGGGGVDGAISKAGGDALYKSRLELSEIEPGVRIPAGSARITGPSKFGVLKVPIVIHAVGPDYREYKDSLELADSCLANAYSSSMNLAQRSGVELLGFSLLSAGVFRGSRPLRNVLTTAVETIVTHAYEGLREVHLIAFTAEEVECLLEIVKQLEYSNDSNLGSGGQEELGEFLNQFHAACLLSTNTGA